jgi:hypothetical protein
VSEAYSKAQPKIIRERLGKKRKPMVIVIFSETKSEPRFAEYVTGRVL